MTQPDDPYGSPAEHPTPPAAPQPPEYGQPPAAYGYAAPPGNYGSWIERVGASIVDSLVTVPGYLVALIGVAVGGGFGVLLVIVGYLGALAIAIWNRWIRMGNTGQSIGKQVLNLKLIREADGQPMGAGMAFVRDLAHILDGIPCAIGYLWPLWDNKRQTFADKLCSSVVVKV
jgi:uncharacterized RDD family membrane protein YckC